MNVQCASCGRSNLADARFCGECGAALSAAGPGGGSPLVANLALASGAILSLVTASAAFPPGKTPWFASESFAPGAVATVSWDSDWMRPLVRVWDQIEDHSTNRVISRSYELRDEKARALFNLLKPGDVRVLVRQKNEGVWVRGTKWEVAVLDDLVSILNRADGDDARTVASLRKSEPEFTEEYLLPREKRTALYGLLAIDDVPVGVSLSSRSVSVSATREDQQTIRSLVEILRGKRLECRGRDCDRSHHSADCPLAALELEFSGRSGRQPPPLGP